MSGYNISDLIELALKNENFLKYEIEIQGQTEKGDGYLGIITFVRVTGDTDNQERKVLDLVVKTSTQSSVLRKQVPIRKLFEKEIYIYNEVLPAFRHLQRQTGSKSPLAKCHFTRIFENGEVVILEDLKSKGFDVWDRRIPMTFAHIKLVLEAFGKWHAFSFAMRRTQPEEFRELVKRNDINMWSYHSEHVKLFGVFFQFFEAVRIVWKEDSEVAKIAFSENDIKYIFLEKIREDTNHHVILHGDSWTNNFMFKNQDGKPADIYIIDWQLSGVASPVLDLSVFIYSCVGTDKYPDVQEFLKIYYASVSQNLRQYNCDPSEVFSYDKLLEHWKKFSCYGIILGTFLMKFSLAEGEEAPDLSNITESGESFRDKLHFEITNAEVYNDRVRDNILHYVRNL